MSVTNVEFNDVDIAPLFAWSKEFSVRMETGLKPVFMRILGDADLNRARVAALRMSAELRRKLRDMDSDERLAYIKDKEDITPDQMMAVILVFSMRDISQKAREKMTLKAPKQPRSDAKTSAHEKYQAEVDSYPQRFQAELRLLIEKEVLMMKTSMETEAPEVLYKKYVDIMTDELCEQRQMNEFKSQCAYYGSYSDKELTERLFSSYEDFCNLPSDLKEQFVNEYSNLEILGDDLKKLQRVTQ